MSNTYLGLWLIFCKLFCSHLSLRRAWKIWMNFQRGFFMSKIILGPLESSRVSDISLWVIFIRGIVNRYELDLRHSLRVTQTFSETIWLCLKIRCKVYYVLCVTTLGLLFLRRRVVNFSIFLKKALGGIRSNRGSILLKMIVGMFLCCKGTKVQTTLRLGVSKLHTLVNHITIKFYLLVVVLLISYLLSRAFLLRVVLIQAEIIIFHVKLRNHNLVLNGCQMRLWGFLVQPLVKKSQGTLTWAVTWEHNLLMPILHRRIS